MDQSILYPFRKAAPEGGPPTRLASSVALLFPDRVSSDSRPPDRVSSDSNGNAQSNVQCKPMCGLKNTNASSGYVNRL